MARLWGIQGGQSMLTRMVVGQRLRRTIWVGARMLDTTHRMLLASTIQPEREEQLPTIRKVHARTVVDG
jgi:hypothetical protein